MPAKTIEDARKLGRVGSGGVGRSYLAGIEPDDICGFKEEDGAQMIQIMSYGKPAKITVQDMQYAVSRERFDI